jgi:signal peptidase I
MKNTLSKTVREYKGFLLFVVLMVLFRSAIADWNDVPSGSMEPTILAGDRIFVNKLAYDLRVPLTHISLYRMADPERGDIVIFDSRAADKRLVKRVIGVPGDRVEMRQGRLIVNGTPAEYSHVRFDDETAVIVTEGLGTAEHVVRFGHTSARGADSFAPVTVTEGHYLVLGDNRNNSADSRFYGFVPRDEIVGRSRAVVVSLDPENYFLPRAGRFLDPL